MQTSPARRPSGPFDLVVSNPPYVSADEVSGLQPEVRDWEPRLARVEQGQTATLVQTARDFLVDGGSIVLECTRRTAPRKVVTLLDGYGYREARISRDLAGRERSGGGPMGSDEVRLAVDAIRAGKLALLDRRRLRPLRVGACATPAQRLYALKGRSERVPTALIASSVDMLLECVPELRERIGGSHRSHAPAGSSYALVLTNPARRYRWLNGSRPDVGVSDRAANRCTARPRRGRCSGCDEREQAGRLRDLDLDAERIRMATPRDRRRQNHEDGIDRNRLAVRASGAREGRSSQRRRSRASQTPTRALARS